MDNNEINNLLDNELRPRWPKWVPTAVELSDWRYLLQGREFVMAKDAIRQTKLESKINSAPVPGEFREIYYAMVAERKKAEGLKQSSGDAGAKSYIPAWLVCTFVPQADPFSLEAECKRRFVNRPGKRYEIGFPTSDKSVQWDADSLRRGCERYAERIRQQYGPGLFEFYIGDENSGKAMMRSSELTAEHEKKNSVDTQPKTDTLTAEERGLAFYGKL